MTMNADFHDAHLRHWEDAEHLFAKERWANADHLYGLAAECGLKSLMEKLNNGSLDPKQDYVHIMEAKKSGNAWARCQSYLSGHVLATEFSLPLVNPFSGWDVSDRYANQSNFNETRAKSHRAGAKLVCQLVKKAPWWNCP
jgi:hypothetical protein